MDWTTNDYTELFSVSVVSTMCGSQMGIFGVWFGKSNGGKIVMSVFGHVDLCSIASTSIGDLLWLKGVGVYLNLIWMTWDFIIELGVDTSVKWW